MMDIILERETANDESAVVVAIHIVSGAPVVKDEPIFEIENSKATQEVLAPETGILMHNLELGETVSFGVLIARIVSPEAAVSLNSEHARSKKSTDSMDTRGGVDFRSPKEEVQSTQVSSELQEAQQSRFSHAASSLLAEHGLSPHLFVGDFITTRDVRAELDRQGPRGPSRPVGRNYLSETNTTNLQPFAAVNSGHAVGRRKEVEIEVLSNGAGNTMLSVLGIGLGRLTVRRSSSDFLDGRITDLVIYEASRLMRKFPRLNAFYNNGQIFEYDAVNAGLAIDSGQKLVVYGIENSDCATVYDLAETIADAIARHTNHELTTTEVSRATFTVTDLSGDDLNFVLPLLPIGQSCIIGITHDRLLGFRMFAGFDHRITEGKEVAAFLGELRERVQSFDITASLRSEHYCTYCDRSLLEILAKGRGKGLLKVIDREGQDSLCCASCWNGW